MDRNFPGRGRGMKISDRRKSLFGELDRCLFLEQSANGDTTLRLEMYERSRSQKTLYAMAKALKFKPYVI